MKREMQGFWRVNENYDKIGNVKFKSGSHLVLDLMKTSSSS